MIIILSDRQDDSDKSAQQVTCLKTKIILRYILYLDIIVYTLYIIHSVNARIIYMCFEFFRNHPSDSNARKSFARKIKFGSISGPQEPSRGALPVRQWHRRDESKILATKRLGINEL